MDEQMEKTESAEKNKRVLKVGTIVKIVIILLLVSVLAIGGVMLITEDSSKKLLSMSESTLEKVIEINELSTVDYVYNAIAKKYDEENKEMYYVAYEGTVTAGINFNDIVIEIDEKEKKVEITTPEVKVQNIEVDMGTMEFIFTKSKYETEDIAQEAYKLCLEDLKTRVSKESNLFDTAKENAISSVETLFKPWIDSLDNGYTVEIK